MKPGYFIAFEGGEGSGKSTQIKNLEAFLKKEGFEVTVSFEPGGTPLGQEIRNLLLKPTSDPMAARTEALLYAASRAEHIAKVIRPALEKGHIVLCDRYMDASLAYQGIGRGLGLRAVLDLNLWATDNLLADRVYLLDVSPKVGLARASKRQALDRLEAEPLKFHEEVLRAYRELANQNPSRYVVVNAGLEAGEVFKILVGDLQSWLLKKKKSSPT
jgi:dTMP kinase